MIVCYFNLWEWLLFSLLFYLKNRQYFFKIGIMKSYLIVFSLFLLLFSGLSSAHRSESHFKELDDLSVLSQQAKSANLPIMLMFGAEWCEFCEILDQEVLSPMALSGDYEGKFMFMRHVGVDERAPIPGFNGDPIIKHEWAYELDADLTPTVIFLDWRGYEVGRRIVGISNYELFSVMIHQSLNQAFKVLNNPIRIKAIKPTEE